MNDRTSAIQGYDEYRDRIVLLRTLTHEERVVARSGAGWRDRRYLSDALTGINKVLRDQMQAQAFAWPERRGDGYLPFVPASSRRSAGS